MEGLERLRELRDDADGGLLAQRGPRVRTADVGEDAAQLGLEDHDEHERDPDGAAPDDPVQRVEVEEERGAVEREQDGEQPREDRKAARAPQELQQVVERNRQQEDLQGGLENGGKGGEEGHGVGALNRTGPDGSARGSASPRILRDPCSFVFS